MSKKLSRRQVYAEIALIDLPLPHHVDFHMISAKARKESIELWFGSIADLRAWMVWLTGKPGNDVPVLSDDGARQTVAEFVGQWGYRLSLWASDPVPAAEPPLDEVTRAQVARVAAGEVAGLHDSPPDVEGAAR